MDPNCTANGTCPWGPGVDPNALAVFKQYPLPNGFSAGDGLNTASYTWSAPAPASLNTTIAKIDYSLSNRNWLFIRGNLQDDSALGVRSSPASRPACHELGRQQRIGRRSQLRHLDQPDEQPALQLHSPGLFQLRHRAGIVRKFLRHETIDAQTRTTIVDVPVQNLVDDLTWTKGRHTIQFGANYRLIHNENDSNALSYNSAVTNSYALVDAGIVGVGGSLDPTAFGFPSVDNSFAGSYNYSMTNLAGLLDYVTTQSNYRVSANGQSGSLLPGGAMINRDFKNNEFEYYAQDSWRITPNLTVSYGLRHSLLQTPYEVNGQQVSPTTNLYQWFETRGQGGAGQCRRATLHFFRAVGQAAGWPPLLAMPKADLAPHFAFAYSPNVGQGFWHNFSATQATACCAPAMANITTISAESIVNLFDQYGSYGLSNSITNPTNVLTPDTSPRFTGVTTSPT